MCVQWHTPTTIYSIQQWYSMIWYCQKFYIIKSAQLYKYFLWPTVFQMSQRELLSISEQWLIDILRNRHMEKKTVVRWESFSTVLSAPRDTHWPIRIEGGLYLGYIKSHNHPEIHCRTHLPSSQFKVWPSKRKTIAQHKSSNICHTSIPISSPTFPLCGTPTWNNSVYMCKNTPHEAGQDETENEQRIVPASVVVGLV